VRWRGDERREWRLAAAGSHFSDGNDRYGLLLDGRQRLYTAVDWQADLGLEVGTSHNSGSTDVPYFNPKSDFTVLPTLQLSHILYRRYQTVWRQHGQIGAGSYSQQDFGTDPIGFASYGQRLSLDDRFDAGVTVSALSRPYDGDREHDYQLMFDLNYRF
jgi:biofilm PGA synthesis protein PgaA